MSTYLTFTIDDLDAEIKNVRPAWNNRSDFTTLRDRALRKAMADYQAQLIASDDIFVRSDTDNSPISLGTEKIATTIGNKWKVALPADAVKVAGDAILVEKTSATMEFDSVPRMSWGAIVTSGTGQTVAAFYENSGEVILYDKDGTFQTGASVSFDYYRRLDVTQTTGTDLDIEPEFFGTLVDNVVGFFESYV